MASVIEYHNSPWTSGKYRKRRPETESFDFTDNDGLTLVIVAPTLVIFLATDTFKIV
jgi:hypothetical protein